MESSLLVLPQHAGLPPFDPVNHAHEEAGITEPACNPNPNLPSYMSMEECSDGYSLDSLAEPEDCETGSAEPWENFFASLERRSRAPTVQRCGSEPRERAQQHPQLQWDSARGVLLSASERAGRKVSHSEEGLIQGFEVQVRSMDLVTTDAAATSAPASAPAPAPSSRLVRPPKRRQRKQCGSRKRRRREEVESSGVELTANSVVESIVWRVEDETLEYTFSHERRWNSTTAHTRFGHIDAQFLIAHHDNITIKVRPQLHLMPLYLEQNKAAKKFEGFDMDGNEFGIGCDVVAEMISKTENSRVKVELK